MTDLTTPIYIKETEDEPWPEDSAFYLLTSTGLFLCRNNPMFRSCAPVRTWPSELPPQKPFLEPSYPKLSQVLMEQLAGFFGAMAEEHRCEAGAYLIYDRTEDQVTARVPSQVSTVSRSGSYLDCLGLDYDNLDPLPSHQMILGTVHSHVYGSAYPSATDERDEQDKPGLHIVMGKLDKDPPDLHIVATVDGARFPLEPSSAMEGYQARRDDFPQEWIDRVTIKYTQSFPQSSYSSGYNSSGYNSGYNSYTPGQP